MIESDSLSLLSVEQSDEGDYSCSFSTPMIESNSASLRITGKKLLFDGFEKIFLDSVFDFYTHLLVWLTVTLNLLIDHLNFFFLTEQPLFVGTHDVCIIANKINRIPCSVVRTDITRMEWKRLDTDMSKFNIMIY